MTHHCLSTLMILINLRWLWMMTCSPLKVGLIKDLLTWCRENSAHDLMYSSSWCYLWWRYLAWNEDTEALWPQFKFKLVMVSHLCYTKFSCSCDRSLEKTKISSWQGFSWEHLLGFIRPNLEYVKDIWNSENDYQSLQGRKPWSCS